MMAVLTEETMWKAVVNNYSAYDGVFYYGVKSTGIFCRPSCKSRIPCRENVRFFTDPSEPLSLGYRPCKRCRPDLPGSMTEPIKEVTDRIMHILQMEYHRPHILAELPSRVGVSPFHLQRSYKKQTGYTPKMHLQKIRILEAKVLLEKNISNNIEICFEVGFQSLSSFYAAFHAITGLTPGEYKRKILAEISGGCYEKSV